MTWIRKIFMVVGRLLRRRALRVAALCASAVAALGLVLFGAVSWHHAMLCHVNDPMNARCWVLSEEGEAPASMDDLQQPSRYLGICMGGRGDRPAYDVGMFDGNLYFRSSLYVSGQAERDDGFEDYDTTPYEPFDKKLPLGLSYFRTWRQGCTSKVFLIPVWMPICLFGVLPAIWLIRKVCKRMPTGCCSKCGYDLRATPERCPECGLIPRRMPATNVPARSA